MIPIGRSFIGFKIGTTVRLKKFDFSKGLIRPILTQLPTCPAMMLNYYALTRVGRQKILLTRGADKKGKNVSAQTFLLDIRLGKWLDYPRVPSLNHARAKDKAAPIIRMHSYMVARIGMFLKTSLIHLSSLA